METRVAALLAPALAWALLGLAAAAEASAACGSTAAWHRTLAVGAAGGVAALTGLVLNVWPFRGGRDLGLLGAGAAVAILLAAALGIGVGALALGGVLVYGVWRIAAGESRGARRTPALLAYVASSLWFPVAGIALLWAALRCFTF